MTFFSDIPIRLRDLYAERFEPEGGRALAVLYWRALLSLAVVLTAVSLVYGVAILLDALAVLSRAADPSPLPPPALSRAALTNVVEGFNARQTRLDTLQNSAPSFSDPGR